MAKRKREATKVIRLRLDPQHAAMVRHLSRLSGENPHAVLRVLLALGTLVVNPLTRRV